MATLKEIRLHREVKHLRIVVQRKESDIQLLHDTINKALSQRIEAQLALKKMRASVPLSVLKWRSQLGEQNDA